MDYMTYNFQKISTKKNPKDLYILKEHDPFEGYTVDMK